MGLTFNRRGILPQVKIRTAVALNNLSKLHRFTALNIKNKLKLYNGLIRSALIYPPFILNTIAKSPMLKLQRVQNKVLNTQQIQDITNLEQWIHSTNKQIPYQLISLFTSKLNQHGRTPTTIYQTSTKH